MPHPGITRLAPVGYRSDHFSALKAALECEAQDLRRQRDQALTAQAAIAGRWQQHVDGERGW